MDAVKAVDLLIESRLVIKSYDQLLRGKFLSIVLFERLGLRISDTSTVEQALGVAMQAARSRSDLAPIEREMIADAQSVRLIRN